ncbi:hypothetical protein ID867_23900 [Streptomyces parvulus]|nr:hypothetical protein [Streptomyces parvulus]
MPTSLAWATTSWAGPSQMPTRQASSDPSRPPAPSATTSGTPPRRRSRKTTTALSAPNARASSVNVPSTPTDCSPSDSLR